MNKADKIFILLVVFIAFVVSYFLYGNKCLHKTGEKEVVVNYKDKGSIA